ncbi:hypothetical protein [Aeromicrobium sp. UC242_57]|uniref:hypothetical protein n=1 Tax=Aeromicrobium sp. UC242_57 TaxID=3374624 RepID=UPI0037913793
MILLAAVLTMLSLPVLATSASAAPNSLQIDKSVDVEKPKPGQAFTYTIQVICSEDDCLDAQIVDELPDGLVGFPITGVTFSPDQSIPRTVSWGTGRDRDTAGDRGCRHRSPRSTSRKTSAAAWSDWRTARPTRSRSR